jgi:hypothetical protein
MWFLLRMTFWLAVVLVLLPTGGSQTAPKSQVSAGEAFLAARDAVTDLKRFCERQQEACVVGSRTAVTLGQRVQAGAKMLYEFLSERPDRTSPNPCELRTRFPFLSPDRICELLASEPT